MKVGGKKGGPQKLVNVGGKLVAEPAPPPPEVALAEAGLAKPPPPKADRAAAQAAMLRGNVASVGAVQPRALEPEEKALADKLQEMGLLPPPPAQIDMKMIEEATRKAIEQHLKTGELPQDMEELLALVDALLQKKNGGRKPPSWSKNNPSDRPGSLPPSSSYSGGPAPNQKQLQDAAGAAMATVHPPPEPGSVNAKVAAACQQYMGTSTRAGPDGGNLACAWSVNNILSNAGIKKVGSNPNYVPSVEADLKGGRGTPIDAKDAKPGDIVIFPNGHHIGIAMGDGKVANNSSSRAAFVNMQNLPAGARVYRLNS